MSGPYEASEAQPTFEQDLPHVVTGLVDGPTQAEPVFSRLSPEIATKRVLSERLAVVEGPDTLYRAAYPGYLENFSRDSLLAMMLAGDRAGMRAQIGFSAQHQGQRPDSHTGEERGKIHHQWPGVEYRGKNTTYNACDTTALFLNSIAALAETGDREPLETYRHNITEALGYVMRHVGTDGLFYEDPRRFSGADGYALQVTYWKDSILNTQDRTEPHYPIVYSLAHFQNADALLRIGDLLGLSDVASLGEQMTLRGINKLWRNNHFVTAVDMDGDIDGPSGDSLQALLYIDPEYLPFPMARRIESYSTRLEEQAGYLAGIALMPGRDDYHTRPIWVHDQALIHAGSLRYPLPRVQEVSQRVMPYISPEKELLPELIDPTNGNRPDGNSIQLWAGGAELHFLNPTRSLF